MAAIQICAEGCQVYLVVAQVRVYLVVAQVWAHLVVVQFWVHLAAAQAYAHLARFALSCHFVPKQAVEKRLAGDDDLLGTQAQQQALVYLEV